MDDDDLGEWEPYRKPGLLEDTGFFWAGMVGFGTLVAVLGVLVLPMGPGLLITGCCIAVSAFICSSIGKWATKRRYYKSRY